MDLYKDVINWIRDCPSSCMFYVWVECLSYSEARVYGQVLQGSVIRPVRILILINNFTVQTKHPCAFFADDKNIINELVSNGAQPDMGTICRRTDIWELP